MKDMAGFSGIAMPSYGGSRRGMRWGENEVRKSVKRGTTPGIPKFKVPGVKMPEGSGPFGMDEIARGYRKVVPPKSSKRGTRIMQGPGSLDGVTQSAGAKDA